MLLSKRYTRFFAHTLPAVATAIFLTCAVSAPAYAVGENGLAIRPKIVGKDIVGPEGYPIFPLRGATVIDIDQAGVDEVKDVLHFNFVRFMIEFKPDNRDYSTLKPGQEDLTGGFKPEFLAHIDAQVNLLKARGVWAVLEMRVDDELANSPSLYDTSGKGFADYRRAWLFLANKYKNTDYIAAYGLLAEPSANKAFKDPDEARGKLTTFYRTLMDTITTVDARTPFSVGTDWNYDSMQYRYDDYYTAYTPYHGRLIYVVNFLMPKPWIQDGTSPVAGQANPTYPLLPQPLTYDSLITPKPSEKLDAIKDMERIFTKRRVEPGNFEKMLSPGFVAWYLHWALEFRDKYQVPMYIDQFGASIYAEGHLTYEANVVSFAERNGLGWARWAYNAGSPERMLRPPVRHANPANDAVLNFYSSLPVRQNKGSGPVEPPAGGGFNKKDAVKKLLGR